jgi:AcrR family transcriptional regulator
LTKKEIIKKEAARLFRLKGYRATSMRDIAQEVGMEAASLYNHIANKQELLSEMLMYIAKIFTDGMDNILKANLSPREKLERLISLHIRYTVELPDAVAIITSEWVHLEEPQLKKYLRLRSKYERNIGEIIKEGIKQKQFANVDLEITVFSFLSTLRWLYSWYHQQKNINPVELEQKMIQSLLDGINRRD